MHLQLLFENYKNWLDYNFPNATSDQQLKGVMEELGELAHADLKIEQNIRSVGSNDVKDAIGDIVMYLMGYCALNDLDISECINMAWKEIQQRDWIKFPYNGLTK